MVARHTVADLTNLRNLLDRGVGASNNPSGLPERPEGRLAINSFSADRAANVMRSDQGGRLSVRGVTAAFWVVLATLAVLQSVSFYNLARREQADRRQEASQQALLDLRTLRSDVRGARARERGFLLTGDTLDLNAYTRSVAAVGEDIKRIKG